jgi:hypothetical protein
LVLAALLSITTLGLATADQTQCLVQSLLLVAVAAVVAALLVRPEVRVAEPLDVQANWVAPELLVKATQEQTLQAAHLVQVGAALAVAVPVLQVLQIVE